MPAVVPGPSKKYRYPIRIGYGTLLVFSENWYGQGDPLYAVLSRRGPSVDWVVVMASEEELDRLEEVANSLLFGGDEREKRVAGPVLEEIAIARSGGMLRGRGPMAEANPWGVGRSWQNGKAARPRRDSPDFAMKALAHLEALGVKDIEVGTGRQDPSGNWHLSFVGREEGVAGRVKARKFFYEVIVRDGRLVSLARVRVDGLYARENSGGYLKPPDAWPVYDRRHVSIALQYMTMGRGIPSEYPKLIRRLAKLWPVSQHPDVWREYVRLLPAIERKTDQRMPDVRELER